MPDSMVIQIVRWDDGSYHVTTGGSLREEVAKGQLDENDAVECLVALIQAFARLDFSPIAFQSALTRAMTGMGS